MVEPSRLPATLEEAVREELRLGMRDPVEIVARLSERHGQRWLLRQLVNVVARIVTGSAASSKSTGVGTRKPSSSSSTGAGAKPPSTAPRLPRVRKAAGDVPADFFASSRWISPEAGWKRVLDLTADDCRAIAAQCERLSDLAVRHGRWFSDAASAIEQEGVATLGEVKRQLVAPVGALPAGDATI